MKLFCLISEKDNENQEARHFFTWVSRDFLPIVFPRLAEAYARLRKKTRGSYEMAEETEQTDLYILPGRCPDESRRR